MVVSYWWSRPLTNNIDFVPCAEGLKEKDKKLIMPVLSAIGLMKDQAYHLARHVWNDVHDDWPFYNEEEKKLLKRYVCGFIPSYQSESV